MSTEAAWAQALLDPSQDSPDGLVTWNHSAPSARLAVYRNNVMVSLVDSVATTFPVTQALVGATFFRAMAQVFVRGNPPHTRVLAGYGASMPDFIATFPPAASVPYLSDVARLEWQRLQALHAADALALDASAIGNAIQDAQALPQLHWQMAPSLHLLRSPFAAVSIWAAHQEGSEIDLSKVNTEGAESALVFRSDWDAMVLQVGPGLAALVACLLADHAFGEAIEQAFQAEPEFDFPSALALLIRHGLLVGLA